MKVEINRLFLILLISTLGLIMGVVFAMVYDMYGDLVKDVFRRAGQQNEVDDGIPYFTPRNWDLTFSGLGDGAKFWSLKTVQPEVVRYESLGGVNYMIGKFEWESKTGISQQREIRILLSRDETWILPDLLEGTERTVFANGVHTLVTVRGSLNVNKVESYGESIIEFEEIKKMFPMGSRVAMSVPYSYPKKDDRIGSTCEVSREGICEYGEIIDILSRGLDHLYTDGNLPSDFVLFPLYLSRDVYSN